MADPITIDPTQEYTMNVGYTSNNAISQCYVKAFAGNNDVYLEIDRQNAQATDAELTLTKTMAPKGDLTSVNQIIFDLVGAPAETTVTLSFELLDASGLVLTEGATYTFASAYFAPGWSQSTEYSYTINDNGSITITMNEATSVQWQAQFFFNISVTPESKDLYLVGDVNNWETQDAYKGVFDETEKTITWTFEDATNANFNGDFYFYDGQSTYMGLGDGEASAIDLSTGETTKNLDIVDTNPVALSLEGWHYISKIVISNSDADPVVTITGEPRTDVEESKAVQLSAANGTITASEDITILNLVGVDVTSQNGTLQGVYIVKTSQGYQKVKVD